MKRNLSAEYALVSLFPKFISGVLSFLFATLGLNPKSTLEFVAHENDTK